MLLSAPESGCLLTLPSFLSSPADALATESGLSYAVLSFIFFPYFLLLGFSCVIFSLLSHSTPFCLQVPKPIKYPVGLVSLKVYKDLLQESH